MAEHLADFRRGAARNVKNSSDNIYLGVCKRDAVSLFVCARPIFVSLDLGDDDDLVCNARSQRGEGTKSVLMREGGGEGEWKKTGRVRKGRVRGIG